MKITVEKTKVGRNRYTYRADFTELPGSPIVGTGFTEADAVATLFIRNIDKINQLDLNYLEINGIPYTNIYINNR